MPPVEHLPDGSLRLSGARCTMLFKRLRPGLLLTGVRGRDDGEFGSTPLDLVEAEAARFRQPVNWFVDASLASNVRNDVFNRWTEWLSTQDQHVQSAHVLGMEAALLLTLSIAQHLSQNRLLHVYSDVERFEAELKQAGARETTIPSKRYDEEPYPIERSARRISCPDYWCEFETLSRSALLVTLNGDDCGQLSNDLFDRIRASIDAARGPFTLLLDVRKVGLVSPLVTDEWSAWLAAFRSELKRAAVLAGSGVLPLVLGVARQRMRLGDTLQILNDPSEFEAIARQQNPAFQLRNQ